MPAFETKKAIQRRLDNAKKTNSASRADTDKGGNRRAASNKSALETLYAGFKAKGQNDAQISESIKSLARSVESTKAAKSKVAQSKDLDAGRYDTTGMYDSRSSYKSKGGVLGSIGDVFSQKRNTNSVLQQKRNNTPQDKANKAAIQRRIQKKKLQDA